MKELSPPEARRVFFVAMLGRNFRGVFEALHTTGQFDAHVRRVAWHGKPDYQKARDLLVLLTDLRRRGYRQEAGQILTAAMEPMGPRFLSELRDRLPHGDQREQMMMYRG
jgi:hypothetical protein